MALFQKNGNWYIDYRVNGRRRRERIGPSKSLAREMMHKRLAERSQLQFFPERVSNKQSFAQIAEKYWQLHGRFSRSPSWRCILRRINASMGPRKVSEIKAGDIQKFYNDIAVQSSKSTANRYLTLIRAIFNKARAWGDFYGENPCAGVKKAPEPPHRLRYLSHAEIEGLLLCAHPRLYPVLVCALLTGMRRGEILGMSWDNVDLERNAIYIPRHQAKSDRPREIPLSSKLRELLRSLGPKPSGQVFELPLIMLRRYFDKTLKRAGLKGFHFHDLRHTFASHYIMRTNDLPALQRVLGHSTPTMTLRYAHLSQSHLLTNMAAFESAMPVMKPSNLVLNGHPGGHQADFDAVRKH